LRKRLADREVQTDIVAAALVGAAVGVAATLLLRPRPRPRLGDVARDTAGRARKRGEAWLDALPNGDDIKERLAEYVETARDAIDRTVEGELKSLRKRLRRSRIGI
jgi:gas vesicle protein